MSDHPVLIPTSVGPIGGVVTEPEGEPRAAAVLTAGVGGQRFGVNQLWTSLARDLADGGMVVLRVDYPGGQGDSCMAAMDARPGPFGEVISWFRERTGDVGLLLIGSCYGARLAAVMGAQQEGVLGVGLITPTFVQWKRRSGRGQQGESIAAKVRRKVRKKLGRVAPLALDPGVAAAVARAVERTRVWALVGGRDHRPRADVSRLQTMLQREGRDGFEVDEIPDLILHTQPSLEGQRITRERVASWASRLLDQEVVGR